QVITFTLGNEWYGLQINHIREIVELTETFYIPSIPSYFLGAINLRGEVIFILNIKKFLDFPPEKKAFKGIRNIIIIEQGNVNLGFIVDRMSDVIEIPVEIIQPPLVTIEKIKAEFLEGEVDFENKLIGILNVSGIFDSILNTINNT
ncbi:MAG: chemotaxis protein CheW, partial [bacterium]|nr:chemotaxis protein CheW [bacterium]